MGDDDPYRQYDERIISGAKDWLKQSAQTSGSPWALCVHPIAAHAPFRIPREFLELYDPNSLPAPVCFGKQERPRHPSLDHLRAIVPHDEGFDLEQVQRVRAAYFATISYLDSLVGRLLAVLDESGERDNTLIVYTSDHGFSCGEHFLMGLFHLMEESLGVPLILAGPGVSAGGSVSTPVSHIDLVPTLLEACGDGSPDAIRNTLTQSLWPLLQGVKDTRQPVFAEYHGTGTISGGYVIRDGWLKLIYFVDQPLQLYDLSTDSNEQHNLANHTEYSPDMKRMIKYLFSIVDPVATDRRAKQDQEALIHRHGGRQKVMHDRLGFSYSPPPGLNWKDMN